MAETLGSDRWQQLQNALFSMEQRIARLEKAAGIAAEVIRSESAAPADPLLSPPVNTGAPTATTPRTHESLAASTAAPQTATDGKTRVAPAPSYAEISALLTSEAAKQRALPKWGSGPHVSLEELIGGRWFTWLGAGALALAVAFFVPWAWRHFEMPAWFRVSVFHLTGLGMLGGAWALSRKRLPVLAHGVAGLGIFTLYASAFAMEFHYKLWGPRGNIVTLLDCAVITLAAIAIALRYNSV